MAKLLSFMVRRKSYLIVLFFTLFSHGLGFGREVTIAYMFGASSISDGILIGLAPLTLFLGMVGVGYANAAMARLKSADDDSRIAASLHPVLLAGIAFGLIFFCFNDEIIAFTAPGLVGEGLALAVEIVRFSALSASVVAVYYWFRGIRYLEEKFLRVSVSEIMPNIGIFIGILLLYNWLGVAGIAIGITFGYLLQLAMVFDVKRINLAGFGRGTLLSHDTKIIYRNTFLAALGMSGVVVELFLDRYFASLLSEGSASSINFAYKVMTLPLYTVVFAIVTVMFPKLIKLRDDLPQLNRVKFKINGMLIAFGAVNSAIFIYFSYGIISLLFEHGLFDQSDVANTAPLLSIYSAGLIAHALVLFHCKVRYALEDFKTPLIAGTSAALINAVLDFALVDTYGTQGLAWATTVAASINALILIFAKQPAIQDNTKNLSKTAVS